MIFPYKAYLNTLFILPVSIIAIFLVFLFLSSYKYWVKTAPEMHTITTTLGYIFSLIVFLFCLIPQCKYLVNGGAYLIIEKENDALTHTGVIESICEPSKRFPSFKSSHCFGADITIDEEEYFAITCANYSNGEPVKIWYLPRSRIVLRIEGQKDG